MNWETAKNWLIAAFLILDIVLGWQLVQSRNELRGYVESYPDLLANTKTLLADHGFTLTAQVPQDQPDMPSFRADYSSPSLNVLWHAAFPKEKNALVDSNSDTAVTEAGKLRVLTIGTWQVSYHNPIELTSGVNPLHYIWQGTEYQLDPAASLTATQTYVQSYKDFPIFDAPVTLDVENGVLQGYTETSIENIDQTGNPKPIISALDALDSLANSVDKTDSQADNKILRVDLGYAHKIPVSGPETSSAQANYWFPVWRVYTEQQLYYINAFTGEVDTAP